MANLQEGLLRQVNQFRQSLRKVVSLSRSQFYTGFQLKREDIDGLCDPVVYLARYSVSLLLGRQLCLMGARLEVKVGTRLYALCIDGTVPSGAFDSCHQVCGGDNAEHRDQPDNQHPFLSIGITYSGIQGQADHHVGNSRASHYSEAQPSRGKYQGNAQQRRVVKNKETIIEPRGNCNASSDDAQVHHAEGDDVSPGDRSVLPDAPVEVAVESGQRHAHDVQAPPRFVVLVGAVIYQEQPDGQEQPTHDHGDSLGNSVIVELGVVRDCARIRRGIPVG